MLLSLLACSSPETDTTDGKETAEAAAPAPVLEIDLLRLFPYTDSGQQLRELDLGTPAADRHLRRGWSPADTLRSDETVVWAASRRSRLLFTLRDVRPRRLVVRYGMFSAGRMLPPRVAVRLNNRPIGKLRLETGWREHAIELPVRTQRPGRNVLELVHPIVPRRTRDGRRPYPRAVAYDWLRLERDDGTVEDGPSLSANGTVIPAGHRVDYYVRVPPAAALLFDMPGAAGDEAARLRVTLAGDDRPETTLLAGTQAAVRLDLSAYANEMVRLSFAAEGTGTVRVGRPRVVGRRAPSATGGNERADGHGAGRDSNVLLYVIDTLRADHLGCYGYPRPTSPRIDALASDGTLFTRTVSQASWTRPATASILTGLYPFEHGTLTLRDRLPSDVTTLAEVLDEAGYATAAFITNVNVNGRVGFKQGFADFVYFPEKPKSPSVHVRSDEVNTRVLPWLQSHRDRPFFLYVHVTDPHAPYTPPPAQAERFAAPGPPPELFDDKPLRRLQARDDLVTPANIAHLVARYDGEIAFVDESLGNLVAELERLGLYERTVIVVTSDHGEEFFEHGGFEHGKTLYQEQVEVPLIVRFPGGGPTRRRVTSLARQIDIMPTVLDYLGVRAPAGIQGRSLVPWAIGSDPPEDAEAFAHTSLSRDSVEAMVIDRWKVIRSTGRRGESVEVYDLEDDPREQTNQAAERPVLAGYGRQAATVAAAGKRTPASRFGIDSETLKQLEELGYVLRDPD